MSMGYEFDYLIVGAGPAGLQLGYYLEQNQRDYLILERAVNPGANVSAASHPHFDKQGPYRNRRS